MNDFELQKSWKRETVRRDCFADVRHGFHKESIAAMPFITRIAMKHSEHGILTAEEGTAWIVAIDFDPTATDIENLKEYAIAIYERTGIAWIRVAHESNGHSCNLMVTPGKLVTSEKLGD